MAKADEQTKIEADQLGVSYSPNISEEKLQERIADEYKSRENADRPDIAVEQSDELEPVDTDEDVLIEPVLAAKADRITGTVRSLTKHEARARIKELERENAKSVVVKITMVDKREASTATDAYFNNGLYAMKVPLDTFVEMPKILVDQAEHAQALIHMQTDSGSVSKMSKKYVIEYKNR